MGDAKKEPTEVLRFDLDGWWWAMVVLGIVIIGFFGFCFCIDPSRSSTGIGRFLGSRPRLIPPTQSVHCDAPWRSWEMGAVVWSILFGAYYYVRFPLPDKAAIKAISFLVFFASTIPNILAAVFILALQPAILHVLAVLSGGILFTVADYVIYWKLDTKIDQSPERHRQRGSFLESLLMADAPMIVGLSILLFYLLLHSGLGEHHEDMEAFAGGAISFQLIVANVIFVLSQGGFIRWVWESHVPKYIESIRPMPSPVGLNFWILPALMCSLLGAVFPFVRLFDGSGNPWFIRIGVPTLLVAIGAGVMGRRRAAKLPSRAGGGAANTAILFGFAGLLSFVLLKPECGMFSAEKLREIREPALNGDSFTAALSTDGNVLASSSVLYQADPRSQAEPSTPMSTIEIIHTATGKSILRQQAGSVLAMAFSSDGEFLATGGEEMPVKLWDAQSGKQSGEFTKAFDGGQKVQGGDHAVSCLSFAPDGGLLAIGSKDGTIKWWDTQVDENGKAAGQHDKLTPLYLDDTLPKSVSALAFSVDGKWLVAGGDCNKVLLWSVEKEWYVSGGEVRNESWRFTKAAGFSITGKNTELRSIAVSRDGRIVAAGFKEGAILLWRQMDLGTWAAPQELKHNDQPVLALLFSDDGKFLASASANSGVVLWDTDSPSPKQTRILNAAQAAAAARIVFSQDGRAVAGLDGKILSVWRPE
jgi:WD40 repeat protein